METQISTQTSTYLVVCYDKTIIGITSEMFDIIKKANLTKGFLNLDDSLINISNVAGIYKRKIYLDRHPEIKKEWEEIRKSKLSDKEREEEQKQEWFKFERKQKKQMDLKLKELKVQNKSIQTNNIKPNG